MKLIEKPHRWMCLAASFAMALDITIEKFCALVGHDGSQVIDETLPEPKGRRGFHIMEALLVVLQCKHMAHPLELQPAIRFADRPDGSHIETRVTYQLCGLDNPNPNLRIFETVILFQRGVIECHHEPTGKMHAVAFDHGMIYDPDGRVFPYSQSACEARGLYTLRLWLIRPNAKT